MLVLSQCVDKYEYCLCHQSAAASWTAIGIATVGVDGGAELQGATAFGAAPPTFPVTASNGSRVLLVERADRWMPVDAKNQVSCANVTLDASLYAEALVDGGCVAMLDRAGITQPPCPDAPRGPFGCDASPGPALLLGLAALLRGRRSLL
jgi:hypothetical protein